MLSMYRKVRMGSVLSLIFPAHIENKMIKNKIEVYTFLGVGTKKLTEMFLKVRTSLLFVFLLSVLSNVSGQKQHVYLNNYQQAREFALEHKKPTLYFITADSTCTECNKMDSILNTEEITSYLFENYINVRLEFLKPDGQYLFKKHNLRTLPSVLILDEDQTQMAVLEPDLEAKEILRYLRYVRDPKVRDVFYRYALEQKNLTPEEKKLPPDQKKMEAIYRSYSMMYGPFPDENSKRLSNQAVVHYRLRSGMAHEYVNKYLESQYQLLTIKNLYFIMNFMDDTRNPGFKFILENRKSFDEAFSKEEVDKKISHLIHKRLYQIQPEPGYTEALELLTLVSNLEGERRTYDYLIFQALNKKRIIDYLDLQRKYISKFATRDHQRMITMIKVYLEYIMESYNAPYYIEVAKTAKKLSPDNLDYHIVLTRLYIKNKDRESAMAEAISTLSLAKKLQVPLDPILELVVESEKMPVLIIEKPLEIIKGN
jgi:hypothetical protein